MSSSLKFHRVTLKDKEEIERYRKFNNYRNCDYSFSNLYNWGRYYHTEVAFHKEMMIVRFRSPEAKRTAYLMPIGKGDVQEVLHDMQRAMQEEFGHSLTIMGVTQEGVNILCATFPTQLHERSSEDYSDYLYLRESLVSLSGKKLQAKRNHINKFEKNYPDWCYEPLNKENRLECIDLEHKWFDLSDIKEEVLEEREMVLCALHEFESLGMLGGCIRVNGKVVAFSLGMPCARDTFDVCIEKADISYEGAYAIINREFAKRVPEEYIYLNREEDLGNEGLRKAKRSYRPEILLRKHTVIMSYDEILPDHTFSPLSRLHAHLCGGNK